MSSPFPHRSPKMPGGGAGPHDDPGYMASLRGGTELARLRMMMLGLLVAPVLILAIVPMIVQGDGGPQPWAFGPPVALALAALLVGQRVPRPMGPVLDPQEAARTAQLMFRQAVLVRFALAEAVILSGLPLAIVGESELVFVLAFVLGYPLLVWLALPTRSGVERIRRRLESEGTQSHLWAGLLSAPVQPGARPPGA